MENKTGQQNFPLCEFDSEREALIEPSFYRGDKLPVRCVLVFYRTVIESLLSQQIIHPCMELGSIMQPTRIYQMDYCGQNLAVTEVPACGAPLAAGILEELIARGCGRFIACGSAGALDPGLLHNSPVIPNGAVRDEGTSYHYWPASRTITAEPEVVAKMEKVLLDRQIKYAVGLNWTTDAPYRETHKKIALRKTDGCLTVDMEYAALLAVAKFRSVSFGQYLLVGDDISGQKWNRREWDKHPSAYEKLFWLSCEAVVTI